MRKILVLFISSLSALSATDTDIGQNEIAAKCKPNKVEICRPVECCACYPVQPGCPPIDFCDYMTSRQYRCKEIFLEAKAAWYCPIDHEFREIYGWGNGIYALEANFQFAREWYAYASGAFFITHGETTGGGFFKFDSTFWFIPATLGVKYLRHFVTCNYLMAWYAGLGAVGTYAHLHNEKPHERRTHAWGGGGNAQLGIIWYATRHFLIDLYGQYTANYIRINHDTGNISGVSLGGAIGLTF